MRSLCLERLTMHFNSLADFPLVQAFRLNCEYRWFADQHFHRTGRPLRALCVVRGARVTPLMVLIYLYLKEKKSD